MLGNPIERGKTFVNQRSCCQYAEVSPDFRRLPEIIGGSCPAPSLRHTDPAQCAALPPLEHLLTADCLRLTKPPRLAAAISSEHIFCVGCAIPHRIRLGRSLPRAHGSQTRVNICTRHPVCTGSPSAAPISGHKKSRCEMRPHNGFPPCGYATRPAGAI